MEGGYFCNLLSHGQTSEMEGMQWKPSAHGSTGLPFAQSSLQTLRSKYQMVCEALGLF